MKSNNAIIITTAETIEHLEQSNKVMKGRSEMQSGIIRELTKHVSAEVWEDVWFNHKHWWSDIRVSRGIYPTMDKWNTWNPEDDNDNEWLTPKKLCEDGIWRGVPPKVPRKE